MLLAEVRVHATRNGGSNKSHLGWSGGFIKMAIFNGQLLFLLYWWFLVYSLLE